jgi:two-component system, chemotaxis family, chemotaxis protein CheY
MKRGQKILVVDDDAMIVETLEVMLSIQGISDVTKAGNGLLALNCFEKALQEGAPFSLVFLDIVMPEMDGQAALKRMRALESEAGITGDDRSIIIMTTSLGSPEDMMEALIDGDCTDYMVKPLDEGNLHGMLAKYGFVA